MTRMYNSKCLWLLSAVTVLAGCALLPRQNAVPAKLYDEAKIAGMPDVRYQTLSQQGIDAMLGEFQRRQAVNTFQRKDKASYLSLSGGGDNGAFGAGLLTGWSTHGDRPTFELVTGVSTGALIAPFAFLGSDYDPVLREVYTEITRRDVFIELGILGALFGDAYADTTPLFHLIARHIDETVLKKIAYEYEVNHRWLLVGTTNLDSGIPVIWNMGKIASIGTPEALQVFRKILLASSAIPGAFPPVMFDVVADGEHYQEMHVDGAATMQVFMYPSAAGAQSLRKGIVSPHRQREVYIIRNARLDSDWRQIERSTLSIMGRGISQLIQSQGFGDLQRIYLTSLRDKVGFNLAFIGSDFTMQRQYSFDQAYMQALFDYGDRLGKAGYPWMHVPPGYDMPLNVDIAKQVARKQKALKHLKQAEPAKAAAAGKVAAK